MICFRPSPNTMRISLNYSDYSFFYPNSNNSVFPPFPMIIRSPERLLQLSFIPICLYIQFFEEYRNVYNKSDMSLYHHYQSYVQQWFTHFYQYIIHILSDCQLYLKEFVDICTFIYIQQFKKQDSFSNIKEGMTVQEIYSHIDLDHLSFFFNISMELFQKVPEGSRSNYLFPAISSL